MKVEEKQIILNSDDDYEFINLINHIVKIEYGEITIKIRNTKPYQIIKKEQSILLTGNNDN